MTVTLDRAHLQFGATASGASFSRKTPSQVVHVVKTGTGSITWSATSNRSWLTVSPASGTGSAALTIGVNYAAGVPASGNTSGSITVTATGTTSAPGAVTVTLSVYPAGATAAPFGSFDTPANNAANVSGSIAVTGWALDDVVVSAVRIMRDPVAGEPAGGLMAVGTATFVEGARPDVASAYAAIPLEYRAGWGYLMLTNMLPNRGNGTFRLYAYADDIEGRSTLLGSRTIACNNAAAATPFGAIDTPGQGATVSGIVNNFGWVLAPGTRRADVPGGGTVTVYIDGVPVGTPTGWSARSDLTSLFPVGQFSGALSAAAVFTFDSRTLADGVHTIAWAVTDNGRASAGVGSRFFSVWNGSAMVLDPSTTPQLMANASNRIAVDALPLDTSDLMTRRGFDPDAPFADASGQAAPVTLVGEELDRFELQLDRGAGAYAGYLRTATGLAPLPIGSQLDAASNRFSWQPGAGFVGRYRLVFVRHEHGRAVARREVDVAIGPKGSLSSPHVVIDTPRRQQAVTQPFIVAGWAADPGASQGTGIDAIHVWAYPVAAGEPIFLGDAALGGRRPDVAAIYGSGATESGYGLTVRGLLPGRYMLAVFGHSTTTQTFLPAATVPIVVR